MTMASTAPNPIRVLIVDDHAMVRSGLRMLIEHRQGLCVAGEAASSAEALALAAREKPDIILLDLDLAGDNGLDLLPKFHSADKAPRVIILTGVRDLEAHYHAMRLGAEGLVLKDKAAEIVIKAIEKVYAGQLWFDRELLRRAIVETLHGGGAQKRLTPEAAKIATLTEREREVISLVGEGLKNKQIADRLYISETTVRHHLTSIFDKLGTSDRLELVLYAIRHGLATSPH